MLQPISTLGAATAPRALTSTCIHRAIITRVHLKINQVTDNRSFSAFITMTSSPTRQLPNIPPPTSAPHLLSPRSTRTLRKLQSATTLSSNYVAANAPSLISQNRQLQQRVPAGQTLHQLSHPNLQPHNRTRSNSDAVGITVESSNTSVPKRNAMAKKALPPEKSPKEELDSLIRLGPNGDVSGSLDNLRHLILIDGLDAASDGLVGSRPLQHLLTFE